MKKGDIVLIRFPFTDLSGSKRRPALILTNGGIHGNDVIVAFISSVVTGQVREVDLVLNKEDPEFEITGLKKTSVLKLDKIATLDKQLVTGEMGSISSPKMNEVRIKLKMALELD
jgi:mRNA interferase MazF